MSAELGLFYGFALLAVTSSIASAALARHPVAMVFGYLVHVISLSGIAILLEAHFIAIAQIVIATGAAAMMLGFALMLVRPADRVGARVGARGWWFVRIAGVGSIAALLVLCFAQFDFSRFAAPVTALPEGYGSVRAIGYALFGEFAVPLELVGLVFLAASVASFVLAKRRLG